MGSIDTLLYRYFPSLIQTESLFISVARCVYLVIMASGRTTVKSSESEILTYTWTISSRNFEPMVRRATHQVF